MYVCLLHNVGAGFGGGMGTPFIGYAYVEKEGEDITGLRVEFASDNMTIFWPGQFLTCVV